MGIEGITKDQYNQILQMLNRNPRGNLSNNNYFTNLAGISDYSVNILDEKIVPDVTGTSTSPMVRDNSQNWIVDTGATNYMVTDLRPLDKKIL